MHFPEFEREVKWTQPQSGFELGSPSSLILPNIDPSRIPQKFSITRASSPDYLVSYLGHSFGSYPSDRVDQGAMALKEYSAFPKVPALLEAHHQIV